MTVDVDSPVGVVERPACTTPDALKVLSDPVRWRVAELLADEELCVCHLVDELGIAQSLVSHHLRAMRKAGLVTTERFRYWTYYRLRSDVLSEASKRLSAMAATPTDRRRRPCC